MTERNEEERGGFSGCFGMMKEMMRNKMLGKEGPGCCAGNMGEMMSGCCSVRTEKKTPADKPGEDAPR